MNPNFYKLMQPKLKTELKYTAHETFELKQAHDGDAGMDVVATSMKIVGDETPNGWRRIDYIEYEIDVSVEPSQDKWIMAVPRSSLTKYNLSLANSVGVIDTQYRGKILFRFKYITQPEDLHITFRNYPTQAEIFVTPNMDKIYKVGDRIGQLIVMEHNPVKTIKVDKLGNTIRGNGGFGSTGK
jgi:dUTP pyrophosphatase